MNVRYFGKKIERNDFGDIIRRYSPTAIVTFKEKEAKSVTELLDSTGYRYDLFGDDDTVTAYVAVDDREDYEEFARDLKDAKAKRKEGTR